MADLFKVLAVFGVFVGICVLCELLADNVPWVIWILIPVTLYVILIAAFGNHFRKEDKE